MGISFSRRPARRHRRATLAQPGSRLTAGRPLNDQNNQELGMTRQPDERSMVVSNGKSVVLVGINPFWVDTEFVECCGCGCDHGRRTAQVCVRRELFR